MVRLSFLLRGLLQHGFYATLVAEDSRMPAVTRRTKAIALSAIALVLALPLASSSVREKLSGAYRGFVDPSSTQPVSNARTSFVEGEDDTPASEQPELEGDFSLADPDTPEGYSDGIVTTLSDLPIALTHRTMRYVEFFAADAEGREQFSVRQRRASRYREHIEESLRYAGFPEDLVWLAAIESGFVAQATSPKGAVGLFQLMPDTAERFGLTISDEVDERKSITRSTEAALAYLSFLHEKFGTWDLALAGYNCGEGCVERAIDTAREKLGRAPDADVAFHELANMKLLPKETADFVPKIHAFAIVAHNADVLSLDELEPLPVMRFSQIAIPGGTRLATIARAAGISVALLREYNPDVLTERLPSARGDVLVNVSPDILAQTLAALPTYLAKEEAEAPAASKEGARATSAAATDVPDKTATKTASVTSTGKSASGASKAPAPPPKITLKPAPMRPGAFLLSSGVILEIKKEDTADVAISARVEVLDPLKNRSAIGSSFKLDEKRVAVADFKKGLDAAKNDLRTLVLGDPASKLRQHLAVKRKSMHDKVQSSAPFLELSQRVFPKGHPMQGALLVGPTEPADDMFLEPEPTWALDTVVTLRGPVDADAMAADIETAFADTFVPLRAATLAKASRASIGKSERRILVGWSAAPLTAKNEAAAHLAFMLACHNKLGRFHRALRHDKSITGRLNCSLELAPQAAVAWVFAMPAMPFTVADVEREVDAAVTALSTDGPTDAEMNAVRGLLRTELARERESATIRGLPKSWVSARNDAILAALGKVDKKAVIEASKALFGKDRKLVVISD